MTLAAVFIRKVATYDVWKCWKCRTRFKNQKEQRGTDVKCPLCKVWNKLDPFGDRQSPPLFLK